MIQLTDTYQLEIGHTDDGNPVFIIKNNSDEILWMKNMGNSFISEDATIRYFGFTVLTEYLENQVKLWKDNAESSTKDFYDKCDDYDELLRDYDELRRFGK